MSKYPVAIDTNDNLYLVHDALHTRLVEDYNPGDTSITVYPDLSLANFPATGIITLTDQCSEIDERAISFTYAGITLLNQFTNLVLLSGFVDIAKPKRFTVVTLNVVADHHNALKDALIAIEGMAGIQG